MVVKRVRNRQVDLKVLLKNRRTCCVCHVADKAIQLHHIDGNPANIRESNLAVLCLSHHDQATAGLVKGKVSLGMKLSLYEVRMHKEAWEGVVTRQAQSKKFASSASQTKSRQFLLDFEFELMKIKNEILTAASRAIVTARLKYLSQFVMEEFITGIPFRTRLIGAYADLALRSVGDETILLSLLPVVRDLHVHLVGPGFVAMDRREEKALSDTLDLLETIGAFGVYMIRSPQVVKQTCKVLIELAEICLFYERADLVRKVLGALKTIRKECDDMSTTELSTHRVKDKIKYVEEALEAV